jgi:tRNA guanosine-2'-O-methyltransferase
MTVDDMRVTKHPQFKNVAVTADYWMPMTEVNIDNIADFMKEKKKEGYTLIGLEQTDKSIVLGPETRFPKKSLFLLGREAEGIPGDLLAELDYCIEIRQRGVIRSMNIQTATAVLVHAYSSTVE